MKVATGAATATATTRTSHEGAQAGRHRPAAMNTSSSTIAMTSVRPSSTTNGVMNSGFSAAATLTASTMATMTRRSVSAPSIGGVVEGGEETAVMATA